MRLAAFLFLFRDTQAHAACTVRRESQSEPRALRRTHARKWDMSSEALFMRARMYGCWPAAEYNSGNTMELGQSCFDARLRSFHLLREHANPREFSAIRPVYGNLEVSVS